ncbi:hypothetical protein SAMN04487819_11662 [Actinopolyspora alba]|uniref:Uncharacterized protein n=1 Tax=Actinopolyspora alba TaxID=673379 RepID=A0A1I2BGX4_9ACTN|nr:hypothetical protein [Actinopolyspora alba]SFE54533.1 hypothetical protein SAMN04487819_11662 [Actinopolyspora alba]
MATTYLGRLGGLRQIRPRTDISTKPTRIGGTHTALSGRRTVDYLGTQLTHTLALPRMRPDEYAFFQAIHERHVPGPLRLLWPADIGRNRLSRSSASMSRGGQDLSTLDATGGSLTGTGAWPSAAPPVGRGVRWVNAGPGEAIRIDRGRPAPVLEGETVTASLYVRSTAEDEVQLGLNHYGDDGAGGGYLGSPTLADPVTLTADTWTRLSVTTTPGVATWAVSPAVLLVSQPSGSSEITLAAAQVEAAASASDWTQGGGAPVVVVDEMPTTRPYVPYVTPELTLMEV